MVEIGLPAIYSVVVETRDKVAELGRALTDQGEDVADLKRRVTVLERMVWVAAGAGLFGGGFVGWLVHG